MEIDSKVAATLMTAVPFILLWCGFWGAFILLAWYMMGRRRHERLKMIHEERMRAMEKGIPMPELPAWEDVSHGPRRPMEPRRLLTGGLITGFTGLGIMAAFIVMHERVWPIGLIPMFVSFGMLGSYIAVKDRK